MLGLFWVLVLLFKKINHASCIFKRSTCYNCPLYGFLGETTHMINSPLLHSAMLKSSEQKIYTAVCSCHFQYHCNYGLVL